MTLEELLASDLIYSEYITEYFYEFVSDKDIDYVLNKYDIPYNKKVKEFVEHHILTLQEENNLSEEEKTEIIKTRKQNTFKLYGYSIPIKFYKDLKIKNRKLHKTCAVNNKKGISLF